MNVYHMDQYQNYRQECSLEEHLFRAPGQMRELQEGWSVWTSCYTGVGKYPIRAARHRLMDAGGKTVYTWDNLDDDGEFYDLILHANGNHYLVFREDLYGYSVLEVESGTAMNYIPEKSWPLDGKDAGETFIWTGVRYDPRTDLLAVSGCYWACPNGTLLLDFSDPLEEQDWQVWLEVQDIVDPDYDVYDGIDLERFGEDGILYFRTYSAVDGTKGELTLPADQVLELVQKKKLTYKERG